MVWKISSKTKKKKKKVDKKVGKVFMLDHFEWYVYFLFVFSLIFYLFIYFHVQTKHVYDILEYGDELDK